MHSEIWGFLPGIQCGKYEKSFFSFGNVSVFVYYYKLNLILAKKLYLVADCVNSWNLCNHVQHTSESMQSPLRIISNITNAASIINHGGKSYSFLLSQGFPFTAHVFFSFLCFFFFGTRKGILLFCWTTSRIEQIEKTIFVGLTLNSSALMWHGWSSRMSLMEPASLLLEAFRI